jgi:hypothetical protein
MVVFQVHMHITCAEYCRRVSDRIHFVPLRPNFNVDWELGQPRGRYGHMQVDTDKSNGRKAWESPRDKPHQKQITVRGVKSNTGIYAILVL